MGEKVVLHALEAFICSSGGDVSSNLTFAKALVKNKNIEWKHLQFKEGKVVNVAGLKLINGKMVFARDKRSRGNHAKKLSIPLRPEKTEEVERVKHKILC